jgi:hypothetical protein
MISSLPAVMVSERMRIGRRARVASSWACMTYPTA